MSSWAGTADGVTLMLTLVSHCCVVRRPDICQSGIQIGSGFWLGLRPAVFIGMCLTAVMLSCRHARHPLPQD